MLWRSEFPGHRSRCVKVGRSRCVHRTRHWTYLMINWKLSSSELSTECAFAALVNLRGINHIFIIIIIIIIYDASRWVCDRRWRGCTCRSVTCSRSSQRFYRRTWSSSSQGSSWGLGQPVWVFPASRHGGRSVCSATGKNRSSSSDVISLSLSLSLSVSISRFLPPKLTASRRTAVCPRLRVRRDFVLVGFPVMENRHNRART